MLISIKKGKLTSASDGGQMRQVETELEDLEQSNVKRQNAILELNQRIVKEVVHTYTVSYGKIMADVTFVFAQRKEQYYQNILSSSFGGVKI